MKPLIAANWKMNPSTAKEAEVLACAIDKAVRSSAKKIDVVLFVPFLFVGVVNKILSKHRSPLMVGAQDCFWSGLVGPHTGSVSAEMLADQGAEYVVVGHSERRREYGESDEQINGKVRSAIRAGLNVILAVGDIRRDDHLQTVLTEQLRGALCNVSKKNLKNVTVAYEPVWAISTTEGMQLATSDDALTGVMMCRKILGDITSRRQAKSQRVIYGGSVDQENVASYVGLKGIDGALPGGASLRVDDFASIVNYTAQHL